MPLPTDISRDDVIRAIRDLDRGVRHPWHEPTKYELVFEGKRYPPKAVIGLAARRSRGGVLLNDFSGGNAPTQANGRLEALGFTVVSKLGVLPLDHTSAAAIEELPWMVAPGDRVRRSEVHASYGGAPRGGIEPSGRTPNVLIFTEPEKAAVHRYPFDGWVTPNLLHYTGEGRRGDQRIAEGNKAILRHIDDGRALRVFRAQPPWATYLGEFAVLTDPPFHLVDWPDDDGLLRQVIIFRLRPVGEFVAGGLGAARPIPGVEGPPLAPATIVDALPAITDVPPEEMHVPRFTVTPSGEPIEAVRRESQLVERYKRWLDRNHHSFGRNRVPIPGEPGAMLTDLFDRTTRELIEAKASAARTYVREGLGQLLDYARFVEHDRRSLLLPMFPRDDLLELLRMNGCGCIWETTTGEFERADP